MDIIAKFLSPLTLLSTEYNHVLLVLSSRMTISTCR